MSVNLGLRKAFRSGRLSQEQYQEELAARNEAWRTLTPTEQLTALDRRLGAGKGATRQRTKLSACVDPVASVIVTTEPATTKRNKRKK